MTYLDTGCLVKLYYPESDSTRIVSLVRGKTICLTPLHELEFANALQLKLFFKSATSAQVAAARAFVEDDLKAGILIAPGVDWKNVFAEAMKLAEQHTGNIGCRSLDVLHCAVAKILSAAEFVTTDARQMRLATAMRLNLAS